jgi:hypothetical protein
MTESLCLNGGQVETGFASVISVEPLLGLLHDNNIYPGNNGEMVKSFSTTPIDY